MKFIDAEHWESIIEFFKSLRPVKWIMGAKLLDNEDIGCLLGIIKLAVFIGSLIVVGGVVVFIIKASTKISEFISGLL